MGHALSNRNQSLTLDRLRAVGPSVLRDVLGLVGVAFWAWAWLSWIGSL